MIQWSFFSGSSLGSGNESLVAFNILAEFGMVLREVYDANSGAINARLGQKHRFSV